MAQAEQQNLPLPKTHNEGFEEKHFLRLQANSEALDSLRAWKNDEQSDQPSSGKQRPSRIKALCGPAKCGKSHLGEIWRARNDALALTPSLLEEAFAYISAYISSAGKPLWLDFSEGDDPAQGMSPNVERLLYTLYNEITHATRGCLLITARSEPSRWQFSLADLRSRMRAVAIHRIQDPSDDDSARLLKKIFHTRQLEVDARIYTYVHRRIERSFRAHHAIAEELDTLSLTHQRKITLPFVARHFSHAFASPSPH